MRAVGVDQRCQRRRDIGRAIARARGPSAAGGWRRTRRRTPGRRTTRIRRRGSPARPGRSGCSSANSRRAPARACGRAWFPRARRTRRRGRRARARWPRGRARGGSRGRWRHSRNGGRWPHRRQSRRGCGRARRRRRRPRRRRSGRRAGGPSTPDRSSGGSHSMAKRPAAASSPRIARRMARTQGRDLAQPRHFRAIALDGCLPVAGNLQFGQGALDAQRPAARVDAVDVRRNAAGQRRERERRVSAYSQHMSYCITQIVTFGIVRWRRMEGHGGGSCARFAKRERELHNEFTYATKTAGQAPDRKGMVIAVRQSGGNR